MPKTNHLGSHHPERRSHSADKSVPKEVLKKARLQTLKGGKKVKQSGYAKMLKKMHRKKVRDFGKKKIKKELDEA